MNPNFCHVLIALWCVDPYIPFQTAWHIIMSISFTSFLWVEYRKMLHISPTHPTASFPPNLPKFTATTWKCKDINLCTENIHPNRTKHPFNFFSLFLLIALCLSCTIHVRMTITRKCFFESLSHFFSLWSQTHFRGLRRRVYACTIERETDIIFMYGESWLQSHFP